jgi:tetraprenyl-beta-curcumene synthase
LGGCPGPHAHFGQGGPIGQQLAQRVTESVRVAGRHDPCRAGIRHLREATHVAQQQRLAERERGEQHPRLVGLQIGQHDEVGALEVARQLLIADEAPHEPHVRGRRGSQRLDVHTRHPGDPQLGVFDRRLPIRSTPRVQQHVDPLVGTHQAEHQHDRLVRLKRRAGGRLVRWSLGEVRKDAVRDHMHAVGVGAELGDQTRAAVLGMHHERVEAVIQPPLCRELTPTRLAREHVVGGEHERGTSATVGGAAFNARTVRGAPPPTTTGQQVSIELLNGKPLEVRHIGGTCEAAVAQHVGHVLGELVRHPHAPARGAARGAVEQLASHIPIRRRDRTVGEATGDELDLGAGQPQRTAQRMVVGWCVGGGVYYLDEHLSKTIRPATHNRVALAATFTRAAFNYWLTVFPHVCVHIARWRRLARRIPDPELRKLALAALAKRGNIEGAAAFAAFAPRRWRARVTTATSAFQAAYNLLDMLGEQPSPDPILDGRRLHEALVYAVNPLATPLDWYEHHPQREDGGYLSHLLEQCRTAFASLPSHALAGSPARAGAARIVAFQSLNLSESQGDHTGLERWALDATPPGTDLQWWETAAAAGSSLGVHALITAAAETRLGAHEVAAIDHAYFPWIGGLHSLLDNLIDKHEDEAAGHRSLVEYYGPQRAAQRMSRLAERAKRTARELPHGRHHTVILAAMIANYLSSAEAQSAQLAPVSKAVLATTGPLATPTLLVFKLRHPRVPRGLRRGLAHEGADVEETQAPQLDNLR